MKYKEELDWLNENNYGLTTYEEDFELRLNTEVHMLDEKYKRREDKLCRKNREEGRLEEKNLLARNMLKDGVEVDKIAKYTNLPENVIMNL